MDRKNSMVTRRQTRHRAIKVNKVRELLIRCNLLCVKSAKKSKRHTQKKKAGSNEAVNADSSPEKRKRPTRKNEAGSNEAVNADSPAATPSRRGRKKKVRSGSQDTKEIEPADKVVEDVKMEENTRLVLEEESTNGIDETATISNAENFIAIPNLVSLNTPSSMTNANERDSLIKDAGSNEAVNADSPAAIPSRRGRKKKVKSVPPDTKEIEPADKVVEDMEMEETAQAEENTELVLEEESTNGIDETATISDAENFISIPNLVNSPRSMKNTNERDSPIKEADNNEAINTDSLAATPSRRGPKKKVESVPPGTKVIEPADKVVEDVEMEQTAQVEENTELDLIEQSKSEVDGAATILENLIQDSIEGRNFNDVQDQATAVLEDVDLQNVHEETKLVDEETKLVDEAPDVTEGEQATANIKNCDLEDLNKVKNFDGEVQNVTNEDQAAAVVENDDFQAENDIERKSEDSPRVDQAAAVVKNNDPLENDFEGISEDSSRLEDTESSVSGGYETPCYQIYKYKLKNFDIRVERLNEKALKKCEAGPSLNKNKYKFRLSTMNHTNRLYDENFFFHVEPSIQSDFHSSDDTKSDSSFKSYRKPVLRRNRRTVFERPKYKLPDTSSSNESLKSEDEKSCSSPVLNSKKRKKIIIESEEEFSPGRENVDTSMGYVKRYEKRRKLFSESEEESLERSQNIERGMLDDVSDAKTNNEPLVLVEKLKLPVGENEEIGKIVSADDDSNMNNDNVNVNTTENKTDDLDLDSDIVKEFLEMLNFNDRVKSTEENNPKFNSYDFFDSNVVSYNVVIEVLKDKFLISHFKKFKDGSIETNIVEDEVDPALAKIIKLNRYKKKKKVERKDKRIYYKYVVYEDDYGNRVSSLELRATKQFEIKSDEAGPPEKISPSLDDENLELFDFNLAEDLIKKGEEDLGLKDSFSVDENFLESLYPSANQHDYTEKFEDFYNKFQRVLEDFFSRDENKQKMAENVLLALNQY